MANQTGFSSRWCPSAALNTDDPFSAVTSVMTGVVRSVADLVTAGMRLSRIETWLGHRRGSVWEAAGFGTGG